MYPRNNANSCRTRIACVMPANYATSCGRVSQRMWIIRVRSYRCVQRMLQRSRFIASEGSVILWTEARYPQEYVEWILQEYLEYLCDYIARNHCKMIGIRHSFGIVLSSQVKRWKWLVLREMDVTIFIITALSLDILLQIAFLCG